MAGLTYCQQEKRNFYPVPKKQPSPVRVWLRKIRHEYELTQEGLADKLGVSRSLIGMWETGTVHMRKLSVLFPAVQPPKPANPLATPGFPVSFGKVKMIYAGTVPASNWGDPLDSDIPIEVDAKFDKRNRFVCTVTGDSCYPCLKQGDKTIWEADRTPPYGTIIVAQRRGDAAVTVKQLDYDEELGKPVLRPINPAYDAPSDAEGWDAIARLVGVEREGDGPEKTWYWAAGLRPHHLRE